MINPKAFPIAASLLAVTAGIVPSAHADSGSGVEVVQAEDDFYCKERRLGTWFYCERPKEAPRAAASPAASARSQLAAISANLEELKARAILDPSAENVTAYVRFQREQLGPRAPGSIVPSWNLEAWERDDIMGLGACSLAGGYRPEHGRCPR